MGSLQDPAGFEPATSVKVPVWSRNRTYNTQIRSLMLYPIELSKRAWKARFSIRRQPHPDMGNGSARPCGREYVKSLSIDVSSLGYGGRGPRYLRETRIAGKRFFVFSDKACAHRSEKSYVLYEFSWAEKKLCSTGHPYRPGGPMKRSGDLSWVVLLLVMVAFGSSYQHFQDLPLSIDGFSEPMAAIPPDQDPHKVSDAKGNLGALPPSSKTDAVPRPVLTPTVADENQFWVRQDKTSCLNPGEHPVSNDELALSSYLELVRSTPMGTAMLNQLDGFGTAICFDRDYDLGDLGGIYKSLSRAIVIRHSATPVQRVQILAHELRHAWQDKHGFFRIGMAYGDLLALTFVLEADAEAYAMAVMWEMHEARGEAAWQQALPQLTDEDLAIAFSLEMRNLAANPSARLHYMRNGMRATYLAWFRDTEHADFYAARMAARHQSRGTLGVGRLMNLLPNILDVGRLPGQPPGDRTSYLDMFEITLAQRHAAEYLPEFAEAMN